MKSATFIVIGGGIAGVSCAETLAFLNSDKTIILITKSNLIKTVINLIPVSKMLTNFDVEEKSSHTLTEMYPNIEVIIDSLQQINSKDKIITTISQDIYQYEYLCICSGAQPKVISFPDVNSYIIGIRDTDSVESLQKRLKDARKVLVVGNGGIASELVHEIKNVEVSWVIKDDHISATFVDLGAAEFFQNKIKNGDEIKKTVVKRIRYASGEGGAALGPDWHKDIDIVGGTSSPKIIQIEYQAEIKNVTKNSNQAFPICVELTNGKVIDCDLIISATGVVPSSNFDSDVEIKLSSDGGIEVDYKMESSVGSIFAAGDVCTASWPWAQHWIQMRLWTQARQMGAYAAKSMTNRVHNQETIQDFCFEMFAHSTNLFGYKVALLGLFNAQKLSDQYELLLRITPNEEYVKLVITNGKIQGAILIGDTGLEETIENLILNQIDVTPYGEDLLNPNIDIEDYFD